MPFVQGKNDAYQGVMLIDPATGNAVSPGAATVPALPVTAQVVIATTGTPVPLPTVALVNGVVIKAKSTNNVTGATVGGTGLTTTVDGTGNGYALAPGEAISFAVSNSASIYVNGTAGDVFFVAGN